MVMCIQIISLSPHLVYISIFSLENLASYATWYVFLKPCFGPYLFLFSCKMELVGKGQVVAKFVFNIKSMHMLQNTLYYNWYQILEIFASLHNWYQIPAIFPMHP